MLSSLLIASPSGIERRKAAPAAMNPKSGRKSTGRLVMSGMVISLFCLLQSCGETEPTIENSTSNGLPEIGENGNFSSPTWPTEVPEGKIDFTKHVRPLLIINCLECHNSKDAVRNGNFNLETRQLAMTTGTTPPAIVPGDPDKSQLISVLTLDPMHQRAMPPTPDKIWGVRMEILRRWISEGADWPGSVRLVHPKDLKEW